MTNPFSRTSKSFVGRVMVKLRGPKKPKGAAASMAGPEQAPQAATRSTPPPLTGIESQRRSVSDTSLRPRAAAPKNASASLRPPSAPLPMILV